MWLAAQQVGVYLAAHRHCMKVCKALLADSGAHLIASLVIPSGPGALEVVRWLSIERKVVVSLTSISVVRPLGMGGGQGTWKPVRSCDQGGSCSCALVLMGKTLGLSKFL